MPLDSLVTAMPSVAYMIAALGTCAPTAAPKVDIVLDIGKPAWSYRKTSAEMKRELPPMSKRFPIVSGYTHSTSRDKYNITFIHKKDRLTGLQCVWPEKATVTVKYDAEIFIAKNYPKGGCRDLETRAHELRHVAADVQLIEAAMPGLRAKIEKALKKKSEAGPVDEKGAGRIRGGILARVKDAAQEELKKLESARKKRHAQIDSVAEYTRMTRACRR